MVRQTTCTCLWVGFFMTLGAFAQTNNVFLDRAFWKAKPDLATVQLKIVEGNDATALNENAFDAVAYALLEKADNDVIAHLLSLEGNGLEKRTHDSRTYIFWAAYAGNTIQMAQMLQRGAALDVKDSHQNTPMTFAASTGQLDTQVYDLFEQYGAILAQERNEDGANLLLLAAPYMKDVGQMAYFLQKGIDLQEKDTQGNGVFNYASRGGSLSFMKALVAQGVEHKEENQEGGNAFLFAAQGTRGHQNSLEVYQYLKDLGLPANVVAQDGHTPLHRLALSQKDPAIIEFFLAEGATVDQKDANGNTPLLNAAARNSLEVVSLLSKDLKDINGANKEGQTALMLALQHNLLEVAEFLLYKGANIAAVDAQGNTVAHYLASSFDAKQPEAFQAKLSWAQENGLALHTVQAKGNTLLHLAASANELMLVKMLAPFDIPINAQNEDGLTALHLAAMRAKDGAIMQYLVAQGADTQIKTLFEETAYDLALENELLQPHKAELGFLEMDR